MWQIVMATTGWVNVRCGHIDSGNEMRQTMNQRLKMHWGRRLERCVVSVWAGTSNVEADVVVWLKSDGAKFIRRASTWGIYWLWSKTGAVIFNRGVAAILSCKRPCPDSPGCPNPAFMARIRPKPEPDPTEPRRRWHGKKHPWASTANRQPWMCPQIRICGHNLTPIFTMSESMKLQHHHGLSDRLLCHPKKGGSFFSARCSPAADLPHPPHPINIILTSYIYLNTTSFNLHQS